MTTALTQARFSALQRAENSSIADDGFDHRDEFRFQCSSASRKFLNRAARGERYMHDLRFSALQRAENSSIPLHRQFRSVLEMFQCSSASRKFLNPILQETVTTRPQGFQCSSASRKFLNRCTNRALLVCSASFSALQRAENSSMIGLLRSGADFSRFSALQRAENSSIERSGRLRRARSGGFSALQRAENSSIDNGMAVVHDVQRVSVLFSEPKIPQ